jgi:hypothetical protein
LGFLTVLEHPQHGLFGGYLVLTTTGRPLEFHCTAPIKPNRAQEILYGPTLEPFLYGEQIGQTLLSHAKHEPIVVCTDCRPALAVRQQISLPVALVLAGQPDAVPQQGDGCSAEGGDLSTKTAPENISSEAKKQFRLDAAHHGGPKLVLFQLGRNRLAVAECSNGDRQLITERLAELAESFDLAEPFGRIREAIEEAQQAVR